MIAYRASAEKPVQQLTIAKRDGKRVTVAFAGKPKQSYLLELLGDRVVCTNPDGSKQTFTGL